MPLTSQKTKNQTKMNEILTESLNKDETIDIFNKFSIDLINKELAAIDWTTNWKFKSPYYWFFIKGGTALRILFQKNNQTDDLTMPAPSDWDTQLVINPDYDYDTWYEALIKIQDKVNRALVMCNMVFTLLPGMQEKIRTTLTGICNDNAIIKTEWGGKVRYRNAADRKSVYLYEYLHPFQSGDTGRRNLAYLPVEDWGKTAMEEIDEPEINFLYPRETTDFNGDFYVDKGMWKKAKAAFDGFANKLHEKGAWKDDQMREYQRNWAKIIWRVSPTIKDTLEDKKKACKALALFDVNIDSSSPVDTIRDLMKKEMDKVTQQEEQAGDKVKTLASGQRTLLIDEFYLLRLMVRYKYQVPPQNERPALKSRQDYTDAWTASGNLRGELIDVTIPRRDTYEARHHGKLLSSNEWKLSEMDIPIVEGLSVKLPMLDESYQTTEQVLIVREILAGVSSSPKKIRKRIQRGYALCNEGANTEIGRGSARMKLIDLIKKQFQSTYEPYANPTVNDLLQSSADLLEEWAENTEDNDTELGVKFNFIKSTFDAQCQRSQEFLKATELPTGDLKKLTTFTLNTSKVASYPDLWLTGDTDENKDKQNNAGMMDFFYIVTFYAGIADQIGELLKGDKLNMAIMTNVDTDSIHTREIVKQLCLAYSDTPEFIPQVSGKAATYCHLKELDKTFAKVDEHIAIYSVDIRILCLKWDPSNKLFNSMVDRALSALKGLGEQLRIKGKVNSYKVEETTHPTTGKLNVVLVTKIASRLQVYIRVGFNHDTDSDYIFYPTEYAYGLPVVALDKHIADLQQQIGAAEFSQSQSAREELEMLQEALSVREYAKHNTDSKIPRLKRTLSKKRLI